MIELKEKPLLPDFQNYMKDICAERGWDKNNYLELFLLFSEEVGELAKAMRDHAGLYAETNRKKAPFALEEEFADVFAYLLDMANHFDIDLETAFRKKEVVNNQREWK